MSCEEFKKVEDTLPAEKTSKEFEDITLPSEQSQKSIRTLGSMGLKSTKQEVKIAEVMPQTGKVDGAIDTGETTDEGEGSGGEENGGNVYGILHHHDKKINNLIPVSITFELAEEIQDVSLTKIKKELREKNIEVISVTLGKGQRDLIVILTGHVFETDITDTIKRLAAEKIIVKDIHAKITEIEDVSNVKLKIAFPDKMSKPDLFSILDKICKEKNLSLIRV